MISSLTHRFFVAYFPIWASLNIILLLISSIHGRRIYFLRCQSFKTDWDFFLSPSTWLILVNVYKYIWFLCAKLYCVKLIHSYIPIAYIFMNCDYFSYQLLRGMLNIFSSGYEFIHFSNKDWLLSVFFSFILKLCY